MKITIENLTIEGDEDFFLSLVDRLVAAVHTTQQDKVKNRSKFEYFLELRKHLETYASTVVGPVGYTDIANYLNSINFSTRRGNVWRPNSIRQIIITDEGILPDGIQIVTRS